MINNLFSRTPLHEHAEPAQRALGIAELPADSDELKRLLTADPAAEVRIAAAQRCSDPATLAAAWQTETDAAARKAVAAALGHALDETHDAERRRSAILGITDEDLLVGLALTAGHAETRKAAAERVQSDAGLQKLADAAKSKDRGVARLAQQRLDAIKSRHDQTAEADAVLGQLAELAAKSGSILSAVVDLDRRWNALDMSGDAARLASYTAARQTVQERLTREQDEQRSHTQFGRRLQTWISTLAQPATPDASAGLRAELAALRTEAQALQEGAALNELEQAEQRITQWEQEFAALASAEALVIEAEKLAADTTADHAELPSRWQAVNRQFRTPALTQRFETAMIIIEQRRLVLIQNTQQEANAVRQQVHGLLHAAEQALAAGQLQAARAAADNIKKLKTAAGLLPKPTTQRLGRLVQQLVELERWESFGQQNARVQLCERAEALATPGMDAPQLALEVQKLRAEWKALDEKHSGVPKALWERFDGACEKAYAPAARHFAEQAALRKQSRKLREEFIATAGAHAPTLLAEPRDWRAIERWLRDTEQQWREGNLGSVEPRAWKKLDTQIKAALAPLRDALAAARDEAKAGRLAMIEEAKALAGKAMERDTLSLVKALQAKWQEQAKALSLRQRDERPLWEEFRAACDAIFAVRQNKRKEEVNQKQEGRRALDDICVQLEQLAHATDQSDQDVRKAARDLADQWRKQRGSPDPSLRGVETRFKKAQAAVDAMLAERTRAQKAAVWTTLAAKESLCEELDASVRAGNTVADVQDKWTALPPLPDAWEKQMAARRDAAMRTLSEPASADDYRKRVEHGIETRRDKLLELELALGLDSPAEFQKLRLALQVKQLRDRFKNETTAGANTPAERLLAWCAEPGVATAGDRQRCERVFAKLSAKP
ncbi:MAG: DUF349 domain-containing protein [Betaproteobacteria bacterium]|nr:DUF349 domain-containing protein [Betaproteobacteria bacterium]